MAKKSSSYPSKKTLNLCVNEKKSINIALAIPLCLVVIALAALFGKFAVADRISAMNAYRGEIAEYQRRVDSLTDATRDYDEVSQEYARYSVAWMSDAERYLVPRTDMIQLIDDELAQKANIGRVTMSGNKLAVELQDTTLTDTSALVDTLRAREDVDNVAVYTAKSENGKTTAVSIVVTMKYREEAAK